MRTSARGDICSRSRNSKHWLLRQSWLYVKDSACVTEVQLHGIFTIMLIARFTIFIMFLNEEDSRPEGKPKVKFND